MFHDITVTSTLYVIRANNLNEACPDCIAFDKVYKKVLSVCGVFQRRFGQNPLHQSRMRSVRQKQFSRSFWWRRRTWKCYARACELLFKEEVNWTSTQCLSPQGLVFIFKRSVCRLQNSGIATEWDVRRDDRPTQICFIWSTTITPLTC